MKKEKKEKKEKSEKIDFDTINLKEIVSSVKLISIIGVIWGLLLLVLTGFYFTASTINIVNYSSNEIQNDKLTVHYISSVNDYSEENTKELLSEIDNKAVFIIYESVLPSLIIVLASVLIVISCKKAYDIVNNVKSNKDLITKKKLNSIETLRKLLLVTCLIFLLAYGFEYIIILIFIELFFEIIIYLFNICLEKEK